MAAPPHAMPTASVPVLEERVTVNAIGFCACSAPAASVAATETVGSAAPVTVTVCVRTVVFPDGSVAV